MQADMDRNWQKGATAWGKVVATQALAAETYDQQLRLQRLSIRPRGDIAREKAAQDRATSAATEKATVYDRMGSFRQRSITKYFQSWERSLRRGTPRRNSKRAPATTNHAALKLRQQERAQNMRR